GAAALRRCGAAALRRCGAAALRRCGAAALRRYRKPRFRESSQRSGTASTSISLPGTEAQKAFDLLEDRFPAANAENAGARVVLRAPGEDNLGKSHRADVEGR
ncbi:MMPL family transporter, partial [Streptomyces sp. NPDC051569]